ncbi:MAG TPA: hypothetical protein VFC93_05855 [Chloroflexota bacterium]|nr:hypothetical protein [Chloroflexota bacterium]
MTAPPLGLQVGLDVVAPLLAADDRAVLVCSGEPGLERLARPWIDHAVGCAVDRAALGHLLSLYADLPTIERAAARVAPGGAAACFVPGGLAGAFDLLRGRTRPWPGVRPTITILRGAGLRVERVLGIGSPTTAWWAARARIALAIRRPDLADRFELRYRRSLRPHRAPWLADLALVIARRPR